MQHFKAHDKEMTTLRQHTLRSFRVLKGSGIKKLLLTVCIFLPLVASAAGQKTIAASPRDSSWKVAVEAAASGSIVVFEAGVYHDCGIALNSGTSLIRGNASPDRYIENPLPGECCAFH